MGDQSKNTGHAAGLGNISRGMSIVLGIGTVLGVVLGALMGSWAWLLLIGVITGWLTLGGYVLLHKGIIDPIGDKLVAGILVPGGGSTPSVAQHSNIEAMEAQGRYAEAAAAYQAVIASAPQDQVAPDKLGQLALRQLKDYRLAVQAYREAERRAEPKRKAGYALLIAGIYRDNLKDYGKAMVELRRIVSTYPDVPNRARLSTEIDELKATHFEKS